MSRQFAICIDVIDSERVRPFWQAALDYRPTKTSEGAAALDDPDGHGPTVWFQEVPEPKSTKNRLHLDISVAGPDAADATVAMLTDHGGTVVSRHEGFIVMHDPEANELCVCWEGGERD